MAIYIIQPENPAPLPPVPANAPAAAGSRLERLEKITAARREDPALGPLLEWLGTRDISLRGSLEGTLVTATAVVELTPEQLERLQSEVGGLRVVPDQGVRIFRPQVSRRQDDVKEEDLWHLDEIGLLAARRNGFSGTGAGVEVAVLDTGADPAHPELAGKIAEHHVFDPATGSIVKARDGEDTDGHGTLVAGLLCGGKVGVAPGARVVSVAMLPRGQGGLANFSAALNWAATRGGLRILNISAGLPGLVPVLRNQLQALHDVGILPVVATGDGGTHPLTYSPGNLREALSVGASARDEDGPWIPAFSSGGSLKGEDGTPYVIPDLVAPGQVVVSARQRGGYAFFNGTSLSAPIVAGVAALIIEKNSGIAVDSLMQALLDSCASLPQPLPEREGAGVVSIKPVFP